MDDFQTEAEDLALISITVPVVIDGVPQGNDSLGMARCVYFTVTAEEPILPFFLFLPNISIRILLLGLQGIIYRPMRPNSRLFVSPDQWNDLVKEIEQHDGLSVDFEYFWVPFSLLDQSRVSFYGEKASNKAARGDVFRLSQHLFIEAWKAAKYGIDFDRFAARVIDDYRGDRLTAGVKYSPEESRSLAAWAGSQAKAARIQ